MLEIVELVKSVPYLDVALQGALAAHALAVFIVNLTETPKDNEYLKKAYTYIEFAAGFVSPKAKK